MIVGLVWLRKDSFLLRFGMKLPQNTWKNLRTWENVPLSTFTYPFNRPMSISNGADMTIRCLLLLVDWLRGLKKWGKRIWSQSLLKLKRRWSKNGQITISRILTEEPIQREAPSLRLVRLRNRCYNSSWNPLLANSSRTCSRNGYEMQALSGLPTEISLKNRLKTLWMEHVRSSNFQRFRKRIFTAVVSCSLRINIDWTWM